MYTMPDIYPGIKSLVDFLIKRVVCVICSTRHNGGSVPCVTLCSKVCHCHEVHLICHCMNLFLFSLLFEQLSEGTIVNVTYGLKVFGPMHDCQCGSGVEDKCNEY